MAIDFPASPNINDTHTDAGRTWTWNGTSWVVSTNASNYNLPIATAGVLGGIKVGPNLNINSTSGVLDVDLSGYSLVGHVHSYSLNSLTDVDTTGAANGKILKHNGTSWVIADDTGTGGGGTASSDPIGTIVMWSGAANAIPTGYQLCDGSASATAELQAIRANVPDLRDKFIVGAGNTYAMDTTGGSTDAVLVVHSHSGPSHSHTINTTANINYSGTTDPQSVPHTHDVAGTVGTGSGLQAGANYTGNYSPRNTGAASSTSHSHGFSVNTTANINGSTGFDGTGNTGSEGVDGTDKNLPPYYALCYVIKNAATVVTGPTGATGPAGADGSNGLAIGYDSVNSTDTLSFNTDTWTDTGLEITYTPKASDSKILLTSYLNLLGRGTGAASTTNFSQTYTTSQTITIPSNVTDVTYQIHGGKGTQGGTASHGNSGTFPGGTGSRGQKVAGVINNVAGQLLNLSIDYYSGGGGGAPGTADLQAGYYGASGGSGGAATVIRLGNTTLVTAGGGGGGGGGQLSSYPWTNTINGSVSSVLNDNLSNNACGIGTNGYSHPNSSRNSGGGGGGGGCGPGDGGAAIFSGNSIIGEGGYGGEGYYNPSYHNGTPSIVASDSDTSYITIQYSFTIPANSGNANIRMLEGTNVVGEQQYLHWGSADPNAADITKEWQFTQYTEYTNVDTNQKTFKVQLYEEAGELILNNNTGQSYFTLMEVDNNPASGGSAGASDFVTLSDTPSALTADKWLKVNTGGTALEWTDAPIETSYSQQLTVANATPTAVQWDLVPSVGIADSITITAGNNITFTNATVDGVTINSSGGGGGGVLVYSDYVSASAGYAHPAVNAFDGSTSTRCEPSDDSTVTVDFTTLPGGGITVNSSLRIYLTKSGSPAASHLTVNGINLGGSVPSGDWLTVSTNGKLETITFYHDSGNSSVELFAVEVDGSILTDGVVVDNFLALNDTPSTFTADKWIKVNSSGNGLEWADAPSGGSGVTGVIVGYDSVHSTDEVLFTTGTWTAGGLQIAYTPKSNNSTIVLTSYLNLRGSSGGSAPVGQQDYTTPGTYSWTCPADVTSVCAVCVGGGGNGLGNSTSTITPGGGGGLGWKNNIAVVPGQSYTVVVGTAGAESYFIDATTVQGGGGYGFGGEGSYVGDGGSSGGSGVGVWGGGGAGGYSSGAGGKGGFSVNTMPTAGTGGAGGGGGGVSYPAAGGGGVGILGEGANGAAGDNANLGGGGGGSGGAAGGTGSSNAGGYGGAYGGGGGVGSTDKPGGAGGAGAVRLIWGAGRAYPSTLTTDQGAGGATADRGDGYTRIMQSSQNNAAAVVGEKQYINCGFAEPLVTEKEWQFTHHTEYTNTDTDVKTFYVEVYEESGELSLNTNDGRSYFTVMEIDNNESSGGGGGSSNFVGLSDTPSTFTADKWLKVNSGGNALEWADAPSGTDNYVDALTFNNTTLTIGRTGALADISVDLSPLHNLASTNNQVEYTTPGTFQWTCPAGVTSVCVVCVGAGGSGYPDQGDGNAGGGGGLGWKNNIGVTPGQSYTVVVGARGVNQQGDTGGDSYFIDANTVKGGGGEGGNPHPGGTAPAPAAGGTYVGDGGGNGGAGGVVTSGSSGREGGGGGAGGYSGNGGDGGSGSGVGYSNGSSASGAELGGNGSGGAGGGGGYGGAQRGGGVRLHGEGPSGLGGAHAGGVGSHDGTTQSEVYGGGGAGAQSPEPSDSGRAGDGAVRIIWGEGRAFPGTNTENTFISTFTGLLDTPNSLTADKWLKVNSTGSALEWADEPAGSGGGYTDGDLDARINTATATTGQILSWTGTDYDWIDASTGGGGGGNVSVGTIAMWSGTISSIPTGWQLCDGTNGSPDLRNKFVIGAEDDDGTNPLTGITGVGSSTGGDKDAIVVTHDHGTGGVNGGTIHAVRRGSDAMIDAISHEVSANDAHYDTTSVTDPTGSSGTNANLPPYYALCYIYCTTASSSTTQVNADWNATSGLAEILNKPTIPTVPTVVSAFSNDAGYLTTQAQVDWNAASGVTSIANKPNFATVATTGSYTDLSNTPSIPAAQIQSDWNVADSSHTAYIQNKPTIPAAQVQSDWSATSGMGQILNKPTVPTNNSQLTNGAGYTTNTGTVTSVGLLGGTGVTVTNSPVTTSGNINIELDATLNDLNDVNVGLAQNRTSGTYLRWTGAEFDLASGAATTTEEIQDIVGAMVTNNTETGIAVTYEDSTGTLDFTLNPFNMDDLGNTSVSGASNGDILKYNSSNGNWEAQAESGSSPSVPGGSQMLFYNSSAPTGWTKITSNVDNRALRVVSGSGASSGGNHGFTSVFSQQNVSISFSDGFSGTTGGGGGATYSLGHGGYHTLASGELPAHSHNFHRTRWATASGGGGDAGAEVGTMSSPGWNETNVQNHGSGVAHRHTQGQLDLADHQHSFSGSVSGSGSDSIDLRVQYLDVILCAKA